MAAGDRVCSRSKTNLAPTTKVVDFNYPDRMLWTVVSFNSAFPPNADINRNASNDRCVSINGQPRELATSERCDIFDPAHQITILRMIPLCNEGTK
jgi:hypothetical protein